MLAPLAKAVERELSPPYHAHAVRKSPTLWAVGAIEIEVVELREEVTGDEVELTMHEGERTLAVDGEGVVGTVPTLERYAQERFDSYVARARRLEGDFWEIQVLPL